MKKKSICFLLFFCLVLAIAGCTEISNQTNKNDPIEEREEDLEDQSLTVIGFSQLGAESDWRSSNTQSFLNTFTQEEGYNLIFDDGQQKQANQITAIRRFIQQGVDYIVLAPVTETGWDTVLQEAKDAGIPVIITDRMVDVSDDSLFTCWVGSDFELEGRKATEWLHQYFVAKNVSEKEIRIVNIQGTQGASAQLGRSKGLQQACKQYGWKLLVEVSGDFTQTKGYEAMGRVLKHFDNVDVVYCENDNEAFGAIEAITEAGRTVGCDLEHGDIMIISFDGVSKEALSLAEEGKISCLAECNSLHGPRVRSIIETMERGEIPQKLQYVDEQIYSSVDFISNIEVDGKVYEIARVTPEMLGETTE